MASPRAFDNTPLTVYAPSGALRGPRTPFSPERERTTFVTPPEVNPERHAQLAGAMEERRGATSGRPTWGASHSTTIGAHHGRFVDDDDTGVVTSTTTEGAHQTTPYGAQSNEGAHQSRERGRRLPVEMHPDGAPPGAHNASNSGNTARRHRRRSYSSTDDSSPEARRRQRIRPRTFDGSGSFESFWAQFQNCASYNGWNDADKLAHLKASLTGDAGQVLWDTDAAAADTVEKLTTLLRNRYSGTRQSDKHRIELRIRRRRPGESLSSLHQDVRRLMALAHPSLPQEARETIACDHYIDALDDADFALKVRERVPTSLDEALRISLQLEAWTKDADRSRHGNPTKPKVRGANTAEGDNKQLEDRLVRLEGDMNCCLNELKRLNGTSSRGADAKETHPVVDDGKPNPGVSKPGTHRGSHRSKLVCWGCGQVGHVQRNCAHPKPQPPNPHVETHREPSHAVMRGFKGMDRDPVYLNMELGGKKLLCLLDSGCDVTLVPQTVVSAIKGLEVTPSSQHLWAANDTEIEITGEVILPLVLNGRCISTRALVSLDVDEVMLGADWLHDHRCVWDFAKRQIHVDGCAPVPLTKRRTQRCRRVFLQEDSVLPPRQQVDVTARSTLLSLHQVGGDYIVDSHQVRPGLYVGRTLLPAAHRDLKVRVINTTSETQRLRSGACLGDISPVEVIDGAIVDHHGDNAHQASGAHPAAAHVQTDVTQPLMEKLPDDMTAEQRKQVEDLLTEYDGIFSKGPYDMGRTALVEHSIDTGDHRPIRQGLRRHPLAHLDVIDRQVDEMMQHDLIEPAASPWAANVVLVRKKDGSHRLCIDYRALNSVTYKDTYPLPHIDTCLGSMDGAVWFSTLDLRSGYHNIPIKETDKDKTAFITRRGCFRYKVLPFGCSTAPSVFQRLMDLVLCGLTYITCLVYLDDIIVYANDFETHLSRMREVFARLRAANLKLHAGKCCLFQRRVEFLGHVLSENGIEVQDDKIATVRDWPTPRTLTELRSFLGLCSYYRRFIAGFADIAAPLHKLQRKNVPFQWCEEQDDAFRRLKEMLISAPVLGMPTDTGTFYLDCDASDVGLGAVLSQDQDGSEVVIAYASRTLSKAEHNYDVTRRELLAVIFGLKTFRQYVLGRQIVIRTDHSALQWLRRTAEPMGQLARWLTFIEQFNFEVVHRAGARHGNADGLSRRPDAHQEPQTAARHVTVGEAVEDAPASEPGDLNQEVSGSAGEHHDAVEMTLAEQQQKDIEIGPLVRMRLQQTHPPSIQEMRPESEAAKELFSQWDQLEVRNGLVYRRWALKNGADVMQLLVPGALRQDFLKKAHTGMTGGHLGVKRTMDQVQRRAFWHGWRSDVKRFCQRCQGCSGYFRGQLPRTAPLQPMVTGEPFETLHFDLTGPHPRSRRGSVYIVTCLDPFSKWAEAFPVPNKEAPTVARVLVEQVMCRFGTPIAGISDRGREVDGQLMAEICKLLDIDKMRTTAYHPSSNGAVERFHATLNSLIGRVIDEHQADWDALLPYVMAAYRASRHEATRFTPNYLVLGREVRAPIDLVYDMPPVSTPSSYASYADELSDRMKQAYGLVRQHLKVAAERNKRTYDLRVRPRKFNVGDWVYYFNPRKFAGRQDKWRRKYSGPYLVTRVIGPVNVMVQRSKRTHPFCTHIDKLKPYTADVMPISWLRDDLNASQLSSGTEPMNGALDASQGASEVSVELDEHDRTHTDGSAIAGVPPVGVRSPRPRRRIRRPQRYSD